MTPLEAALVAHIDDHGPIGFDDFVAQALYAPGLGFYATGSGAGRRRDFLTSPEIGPLFGAVVARALDTWWDGLGRPDPFHVVEAGAGPGALARSILASAPRCGAALRLTLVEATEVQWSTHPVGVTSRTELPAPGELGAGPVVVIANELLDNLPFGLVELLDADAVPTDGDRPNDPDGVWCEVVVAVDRSTGEDRLVERYVPLEPARQGWCWGRAGRSVAVGTRLPIQAEASVWLAEALELAAGGRIVVVDYASTTPEMAQRPWTDWLRTYVAHGRGGHPLRAPGSMDITCEVAVDQLSLVQAPDRVSTQAEFLAEHGIEDLVAEGRDAWHAGRDAGKAPGLEAIAARSRVHEAEALTDPSGPGAFKVLEWNADTMPGQR